MGDAITLPLARRSEASPQALRILLVEDDDGDARLLVELAREARLLDDLDIRRAASLEEARGLLTTEIDLVLLDLGLPDSVGIETYRAVARSSSCSVVVLTGMEDDEVALATLREGAQDYLVKGQVTPALLERVVRYATERGRLQRLLHADLGRRERLLGFSHAALGDDAIQDLADLAATLLRDELPAEQVLVAEERNGTYEVVAVAGEADIGHGAVIAERGDGSWTDTIAADLGPVVLEDVAFARGESESAHAETRACIGMALPGLDGRWVIAALVAAPRAWPERDVAFLRQLSDLLAQAISGRELEAERAERTKELTALRGVARAVQLDDPATVLERIADELSAAFQFVRQTLVEVELRGRSACRPTDAADRMIVSLRAPIDFDGRPAGHVRVGYDRELPFLAEEQELLDAVAESLAVWQSRADAMREVREANATLALTLEQVPAVVYVVDPDLRLVSANGALIADFDVDDLDGATAEWGLVALARMVGFQPVDEFVAAHERALAGESGSFEGELDGRWLSAQVEPLAGPGGAVVGLVGLVTDQTEEHRRRRELEESQARLRALFDNALDAFLLADDDHRYVEANPAAQRLLGYTTDELVGMTIEDILPPGGAEPAADAWDAFRTAGQLSGDIVLRRKDDREVTVHFQAVADIRPGLHLSVMRDITDRVRAEAAVRASEKRFRDLAERSAEGIYRQRLRPERGFEYVNPKLEAITGLSKEEIYADSWLLYTRTHPEDRLEAHTGSVEPTEHRFQRGDGRWIWVELHEVLIHEDDEVVAVHGIVRDITERKRQQEAFAEALRNEHESAERLRRLDEMKNDFLRTVSHELRTPMTSINGFARTLQAHADALDSERRQTLLDRLVANTDRLKGLLEDLFDINRLTSSDLQATSAPTDLSTIAARVLETVPMEGRELHRDLRPAPLRGDAGKLARVVHNLLRNAVRHTPVGTTVWLRTGSDGREVWLEVEDDGPGVPEEIVEVVFEPFRQGAEAAGAANPGTGIGLTLVARLVELHGGTASLAPPTAGGARFRVVLPSTPPRESA